MSQYAEPLIQFANRGILPFTGRDSELKKILEFCTDIEQRESLNILLISGEAGIGKSRLTEEAIPLIIEQGTAVLRIKIHADTAQSLISLLADALWRTQPLRLLIREHPQATPESVISSLRRIARLRRFLLIIEDIHLLHAETSGVFQHIVSALAEEAMGVVCTARPMELALRGILHPYLQQEVQLEGLATETIAKIWSILFREDIEAQSSDRSLLQSLKEATAGNPLALRMALRAGVKSETQGSGRMSSQVVLHMDKLSLWQSLAMNTRLFSSGMTAHLTPQEHRWAEELAALGEVFAAETVMLYIDKGTEAIECLKAKGIIIEAYSHPVALGNRENTSVVYCFIHTLLFKHVAEQKRFDIDKFWLLLAEDVPLYTLFPFRLASLLALAPTKENPSLHARALRTIERMVEVFAKGMVEEDLNLLADFIRLLPYKIAHNNTDPLYTELRLLEHRIQVLINGYHFELAKPKCTAEELLLSVQEYFRAIDHARQSVAAEFLLWTNYWMFFVTVLSAQRYSPEYWNALYTIITSDEETIDVALALRIVGRMLYLFSQSNINDHEENSQLMEAAIMDIWKFVEKYKSSADKAVQEILLTEVFPFMMIYYEHSKESQERSITLYNAVQNSRLPQSERAKQMIWRFTFAVLNIEYCFEIVEYQYRNIDKSTSITSEHSILYRCITLMIITNAPAEEIQSIILQRYLPFFRNKREAVRCYMIDEFRQHAIAIAKPTLGLDIAQILERPTGVHEKFNTELLHCYSLGTLDESYTYLQTLLKSHRESGWMGNILGMATSLYGALDYIYYVFDVVPDSEQKDMALTEKQLRFFFTVDVLESTQHNDIVIVLLTLSVGEKKKKDTITTLLRPEIRSAIFRTMEWLLQRKRVYQARIYPQYFAQYFEDNEIEVWTKRIEYECEEQRQRLYPYRKEGDTRIKLSMFGRVGFRKNQAEELHPIKGNRLKTLLGLMTLDAILAKPLTRREFFDIAAGEEQDDETKRNTVKVAVYQLRKLLGQHAVVQGKEKPEFDLEKIRVDAIEIWQAVQAINKDRATHSLKSVRNNILHVLRSYNGDVLFPTLYDTLFETAREEFENHLREAIVWISHEHIRENDLEYAERILREAVAQLPGDEEIAELFTNVLELQNKKIEAVRTRKMAEHEPEK